MSSKDSIFPSGVSAESTAPYAADIGGISLRDELDSLLNGLNGEIAKGQTIILRRMRRNDDGSLVTCPVCVDSVTLEPDRDYPTCPYCLGTGRLWDEETFIGYRVMTTAPTSSSAKSSLVKAEIGEVYLPSVRFFIPYDVDLIRSDRLVEIKHDLEGDVVIPIVRKAVYEVELLRDLRADNGRVEFWVAHCQELGPATQGFVG